VSVQETAAFITSMYLHFLMRKLCGEAFSETLVVVGSSRSEALWNRARSHDTAVLPCFVVQAVPPAS
jgi:xanthine/uracil/vitamin C permease (AzgA family)